MHQLLQQLQRLQRLVESHERLRAEDRERHEVAEAALSERVEQLQQELARLDPDLKVHKCMHAYTCIYTLLYVCSMCVYTCILIPENESVVAYLLGAPERRGFYICCFNCCYASYSICIVKAQGIGI